MTRSNSIFPRIILPFWCCVIQLVGRSVGGSATHWKCMTACDKSILIKIHLGELYTLVRLAQFQTNGRWTMVAITAKGMFYFSTFVCFCFDLLLCDRQLVRFVFTRKCRYSLDSFGNYLFHFASNGQTCATLTFHIHRHTEHSTQTVSWCSPIEMGCIRRERERGGESGRQKYIRFLLHVADNRENHRLYNSNERHRHTAANALPQRISRHAPPPNLTFIQFT